MLNLAVMIADTARNDPDRLAVIDGDRAFTYAQLHAAARTVARFLLDCGVQRGDRVAMTVPNSAEFPIVYFGILHAGGVVVPMNTMLKRDEVAYHLRDSGAKVYFWAGAAGEEGRRGFEAVDSCEHLLIIGDAPGAPVPGTTSLADVLRRPAKVNTAAATEATDTAVVLYTSGTTGKPKGAELTHANMVLNAFAHNRLLEASPSDVHLVTLPLFHSFGQTVHMNAGFSIGATLVLVPRFDAAAALQLMAKHRVTVFAGVPTMYWALIAAADQAEHSVDLARLLRIAVSGGAAMPVELLARFKRVFGIAVREGYGLTETSPTVTFNPLGSPNRPGSIGQPIWGVEIKLIDPDWNEVGEGEFGELAVRGHNVMKGYLGRPEATAEVVRDGWFRTGDIARRDDAGYYYIVDRAKDLIVRGGFNVYPREVEETLIKHPEVSLVAVVGVPDPRVGEEVKAFVIRQPGSALTAEDLITWSRDRLATYKCPRAVEFRETLPTNTTGKLLKRELR